MKLLAFLDRFDHHSYRGLCGAVNRHGHGRHHGGVAAALGQIGARTEILSIPRDRPFPTALTQVMAGKLCSPGRVQTINLRHGHDGFLGRKA
jgi:homoserine O-acetyltransferase